MTTFYIDAESPDKTQKYGAAATFAPHELRTSLFNERMREAVQSLFRLNPFARITSIRMEVKE